jgi:hypothetical protein
MGSSRQLATVIALPSIADRPKPRYAVRAQVIRAHSSNGLQTMPPDGALTLSDVRGPTLGIICEPCGRRARYKVAKLVEQHGDAKLTDLLLALADCRRSRSASAYDRCNAVYEGL